MGFDVESLDCKEVPCHFIPPVTSSGWLITGCNTRTHTHTHTDTFGAKMIKWNIL